MKIKNQKGVVLLVVLAGMIILSVIGTVATTTVASSIQAQTDQFSTTEAFAIATAGAEWYVKQLADDTSDWHF